MPFPLRPAPPRPARHPLVPPHLLARPPRHQLAPNPLLRPRRQPHRHPKPQPHPWRRTSLPLPERSPLLHLQPPHPQPPQGKRTPLHRRRRPLLKPNDLQPLLTLNSKLLTQFHMYPDRDLPGERLFLQLQALLPNLTHHHLPPDCKDYSDLYLQLHPPTTMNPAP